MKAEAEGKRGQVQFAGTARRVLHTNWTCPLFPGVTQVYLVSVAERIFGLMQP